MLRSTLKFIAGALIGIAVWLYGTPAYNTILAAGAEPLLHIDSRLRDAEVFANERRIIGRGVYIPYVIIPAEELTYNVILLLALMATHGHAVTSRGLRQISLALLVLFITHIVAVALTLESTWATRANPWSDEHYSSAAQAFWRGAEWSYRLAGMFAIAFGCWWLTRSEDPSSPRYAGESSLDGGRPERR